jgi:adenylyl-sulfate kinase
LTRQAFTLWFTGLPGSGKTTLARAVGAHLAERGIRVAALDGDEIRQYVSPNLGFSKSDRDLNVRRIGQMACLLARDGIVPIVAAVSPYRQARLDVRRALGGSFVEIYMACDLDALIARDPKGLYAKALRGEIEHFTGVSDPYEAPPSPDLTIHTENEAVETSLQRIVHHLEARGMIPAPAGQKVSGRRSTPHPPSHDRP